MVGPLLEQLGVHLVVGHHEHQPHLEHGAPDGGRDAADHVPNGAAGGVAGDALRRGRRGGGEAGGGGADAQRARHREGDAEAAAAEAKEGGGCQGAGPRWRREGERAKGTGHSIENLDKCLLDGENHTVSSLARSSKHLGLLLNERGETQAHE